MGSKTGIFTPFFALDLNRDNSRASSGEGMATTPLFIGQKLAAGTAVNGAILQVNSLEDVEVYAGKGSHLYDMMKAYFSKRSTNYVSIGVLDDDSGATAATRDIVISGAPTEAGTLGLRVNGTKFEVVILKGATTTKIATDIATAIGADPENYFSATSSASVVTVTVANKGTAVGGISIEIGSDSTDRTTAGLDYNVEEETPGTGSADIQPVLDSIGASHFFVILAPYSDSVNVGKAQVALAELGDKFNARDSIYITPIQDTVTNLIAYADSLGDRYISLVDTLGWQSSDATILGVMGREVADSVRKDVNLPLHNLVLPFLVPPVAEKMRVWADRNLLAGKGIAGLDPEQITIEAPCTTNTNTAEERRWENIFNLTELRISFKNLILQKFARAKLKKGDEAVSPSTSVITIPVAAATASGWYAKQVFKAQTEDQQYFDSNIVVSLADVDTLEWFLPITLVGQYVVSDGSMNYILGGSL